MCVCLCVCVMSIAFNVQYEMNTHSGMRQPVMMKPRQPVFIHSVSLNSVSSPASWCIMGNKMNSLFQGSEPEILPNECDVWCLCGKRPDLLTSLLRHVHQPGKVRHLITSLTHSYTHFWKPPERSSILKWNRRPVCCAQADWLCVYNLWIYRVYTTHCSYRRPFGNLYDRVWALTPTLWINNRCLIHTLLLIRICLQLWDNKLTRTDPKTGGENHLS